LSFEFGYETNIAGIDLPPNFHVRQSSPRFQQSAFCVIHDGKTIISSKMSYLERCNLSNLKKGEGIHRVIVD